MPVTSSPSTRNEEACTAPFTTAGWNCQSDASSSASSQRESSRLGTSAVAAARSMRAAVWLWISAAESTGSPASATNPVGRLCTAETAAPMERARPSPAGISSSEMTRPGTWP